MHCTNGIVVQESTGSNLPITGFVRNERPCRKRSFSALPNQIAHYTTTKRVGPDDLKDVQINECPDISKSEFVDFIWTLCSEKNPSGIPNWTGFNYLLHEEGDQESLQTVTYLPAINQSPTKLDTVLELLLQSKAKAEHLGLDETDIVVDQAIYAKAVEVLQNPAHQDLKKFIVLRMGGFHIECTFIAVIGKRFSDAGLRDLLIETGLFGKKKFVALKYIIKLVIMEY